MSSPGDGKANGAIRSLFSELAAWESKSRGNLGRLMRSDKALPARLTPWVKVSPSRLVMLRLPSELLTSPAAGKWPAWLKAASSAA